ncbi:MAG: RDD family protein [Minicystis sp.]
MLKREAVREPLDTTTEIETPEHVRFRYHVAGPAMRALAWLIDLLARGAIAVVVVVVGLIAGISADNLGRASSGVILLALFLLEWFYYVFFETLWSGRTPGKRALSLRVVTEGGHPLTFADSLLRNLLRAADFLPFLYAVGLVVMGRDRRFRRLGNLAAGTIVIAEERHAVGATLRLDPPPTAAELRSIPQRVPLTGDEMDAVELFLRRQGRLSAARENELAEMVAPVFAKRLGVRYKDATRFLGLLHHRAREQQRGRSS